MAQQRAGATIFDAYTIGDAVGEGGSGAVFAATDRAVDEANVQSPIRSKSRRW